MAVGVALPGHHVFALGVGQKVHPQGGAAVDGVAGEAHASACVRACVAKHHALDGDGGAQVVVYAVEFAVGAGFGLAPGVEHGLHRAVELVGHVLRKRLARGLLVQRQKAAAEGAQLAEIEFALVPALGGFGQGLLEQVAGHARHHFTVGGDEPAVGIPHQAGVAGLAQQAGQGLLAQADVEQGFHHAGHGHGGTGAHRHDERVAHIAKAHAGELLQGWHAHGVQGHQAGLRVAGVVGADDQGRGHGQPELGHFEQVVGFGAHVLHTGLVACRVHGRRSDEKKVRRPAACVCHGVIPVFWKTSSRRAWPAVSRLSVAVSMVLASSVASA